MEKGSEIARRFSETKSDFKGDRLFKQEQEQDKHEYDHIANTTAVVS